MQNVYLASNAPVEKKQLCKYENFWQYQEGANRWGDERAQFAAMAKYLYRNALLGQVFQNWCFPYTSQTGWQYRQAHWCQTRNDYLTVRYCAAALPVAKRRVENLQHLFFLGARRDFSDVLLVFPRATWLRKKSFIRYALEDIVYWLHGEGICFEFRSEPRIADGVEDLADYKVIILPFATYLEDTVSERLLTWVREGGVLVCLGPAGMLDKYGHPDGKLMAETLGVAPTLKDEEWDFGVRYRKMPLIQKKAGRGAVVVVALKTRDMFEKAKLADRVEEIIRQAAPPFARADGDVFEFFRRVAPNGTKYLAVLNPNPDADVTATIRLRGEFKRVVDVDIPGGLPAPIEVKQGCTRFPLRLQLAGMTVLRLDK